MPDLQTALEPSAPAPAPVATPQPAQVNTGVQEAQNVDANTQINDFIEVDGRRPAPQPAAKPAETGKYQDLSAANKGYDELYKLYTQGAARTANTVDKLEKALTDLPTQLAQLLTKQTQPATPTPQPVAQPQQQASRFKFNIDELADPDALAASLDRQLSPLLGQSQAQLDPNKLVEGLAPRIGEIIQQQLAAREEAALRSRAEADIKALTDAGNDAGLVQAAVAYAINTNKNVSSVPEAWKIFQAKFPQVFAQQKAEDIMGEMAGQRQQVPRDLGAGVNVANGDALRTAFDSVRKHKFASQEFL